MCKIYFTAFIAHYYRNDINIDTIVFQVIRPVDKAKNDEPKNFAFVTFQREEITRKLVGLLVSSCTAAHILPAQVKLGEDVMCGTKIVIKPVSFSISQFKLNTEQLGIHVSGDHKRSPNGTTRGSPSQSNGSSSRGTRTHGGSSNAKANNEPVMWNCFDHPSSMIITTDSVYI